MNCVVLSEYRRGKVAMQDVGGLLDGGRGLLLAAEGRETHSVRPWRLGAPGYWGGFCGGALAVMRLIIPRG